MYSAEELVRGLFEHAGAGRTVDVLGVGLTLPPEARFASVDAVQRYADQVLGPGAVRVRARAGAGGAHYERGAGREPTIAVPAGRDGAWALRELVVLHELAHHVVAERSVGGRSGTVESGSVESGTVDDGAAHGPAFTAALVELVSRVMGPEAGLALRIVYTESGVAVG